ncbi:hypothetical protein ES708_16183 [subsurface metagenome]
MIYWAPASIAHSRIRLSSSFPLTTEILVFGLTWRAFPFILFRTLSTCSLSHSNFFLRIFSISCKIKEEIKTSISLFMNNSKISCGFPVKFNPEIKTLVSITTFGFLFSMGIDNIFHLIFGNSFFIGLYSSVS